MLISIPCIAGCTGSFGEPVVGQWDSPDKMTFTSDGKIFLSDGTNGTWKVADRGETIRYNLYGYDGALYSDVLEYFPKTDTIQFVGSNVQYHRLKDKSK